MANVANVRRRGQGPKKRHWCFTSFLDTLPTTFNASVVRYCVYQREVSPETKKEHFQGYIELYDSLRIGQVKKILGECHLEPRRGTRSTARDYCLKEDSAISGTQVIYGEWRDDVSRKRTLNEMLKGGISIPDLIAENPAYYVRCFRGLHKLDARHKAKKAKTFRNISVTVYIGPTGSGKTRKACEQPDHFFIPCSKNLWFDNYNGEDCLIIDDFYGNKIMYSMLLRILDGYELQVQVKGSYVWAEWTKVIITSNKHPSEWYTFGYTPALQRRIDTLINLTVPDNVFTPVLLPRHPNFCITTIGSPIYIDLTKDE